MTPAPAPAALRPVRLDPPPARAALPTTAPAVGPRSPTAPRLRLLRHEPDPDGPTTAPTARGVRAVPPVPADLSETADLRRRAHQVLTLILEVLDGRRLLAQLTPHLEPSVLRYVRAAIGRPPARQPPPRTSRLTSLHVSRPCAGAIEVAAVRREGGRARALAARFEGRPDEPDRWRCATLRLL